MKVLLAGATGAIGGEVLDLLRDSGHHVRALTRRAGSLPNAEETVVGDALVRASLDAAVVGVDVVVSSVGASVGLGLRGRATYSAVDVPANLNLLDAAKLAGVRRFVYLGVHPADGYAHTRYVRAHEAVEEALRQSGLSTTTVRPVGVFTALHEFLDMARRGRGQMIGDGSARTNPIHPTDVAQAVVAHLEAGPEQVSVGGPDVLTRRDILELAFAALGKEPRISGTPPGAIRAMVPLVRLVHPRMGDLMEFAVEVSTHDGIAPAVGTRRLADYFAELARAEVRALPS